MQLENIKYYKDKLITDGYLNIELNEILPDLYEELDKIVNQDILEESLNCFESDIITKGIYTKEKVQEIYSDFNHLIETERIDLFDSPDGSDTTKLILKLTFKKSNNTLNILKEVRNRFIEITDTQTQQWLSSSELNEKISNVFSKITNDIVDKFYNETIEVNHNRITCFLQNDLITEHEDAVSADYLCVILLYLNRDYKVGYGGELVVNHNDVVPAKFGRLAVLDFTKNNITHRVDKVEEDYMRFALSNFIEKRYTENI